MRRRRTDEVRDLGECGSSDRRVDREHHQRLTAGFAPAHLHRGDVDTGVAEHSSYDTNYTRTVVVLEEDHVCGCDDVDVEAVDLGELLDVPRAGERAADRDLGAGRE